MREVTFDAESVFTALAKVAMEEHGLTDVGATLVVVHITPERRVLSATVLLFDTVDEAIDFVKEHNIETRRGPRVVYNGISN